MYRVITNTTKEEHFESPTAAAYGMSIHCGNVVPYGQTMKGMKIVPREVKLVKTPPMENVANVKISDIKWNDYGSFDAYGDLYIHGDIYGYGNLDVNGSLNANGSLSEIKLIDTELTPTSPGVKGEVKASKGFLYICIGTDSWIRSQIQIKW